MLYENDKLRIRVIEKEDLQLMKENRYSFDIRPFYRGIEDPSISQQEEWFEKLQKNQASKYYICEDLKKKQVYSIINFSSLNLLDRNTNVGWYFLKNNTQNMNAGNSVIIFLDYLFSEVGLRKVYSDVISYNKKALKFNEKIGFKIEGKLREHAFRYGVYNDLFLVGLLSEDFFKYTDKIRKKLKLDQRYEFIKN